MLFAFLNDRRQILRLCPLFLWHHHCPNSGPHHLSEDYYNSLLTGLSAPICLPLIHSLYCSLAISLTKKAAPFLPSWNPSRVPPCTEDKIHIISAAHRAPLLSPICLSSFIPFHYSSWTPGSSNTDCLRFPAHAVQFLTFASWFFWPLPELPHTLPLVLGLLTPPDPWGANSSIASEKHFSVTTCTHTQVHTCAHTHSAKFKPWSCPDIWLCLSLSPWCQLLQEGPLHIHLCI